MTEHSLDFILGKIEALRFFSGFSADYDHKHIIKYHKSFMDGTVLDYIDRKTKVFDKWSSQYAYRYEQIQKRIRENYQR